LKVSASKGPKDFSKREKEEDGKRIIKKKTSQMKKTSFTWFTRRRGETSTA